jgi:arylsulfatase A-like enzyme
VWAHPRWAVALCCLALACGAGERAREPVNVVLISIDSLRADHLHSYGYGPETSPNIDRLAAESVLFENVIADSSWTLPAHASLFTGLTSRVHRVSFDGHRLDPQRTTLAEVLSGAGYRTRGLWSGPYLHPIFGFDQGFGPGDYQGVIGPSAYDDPEAFAARDPRDAARLRRELNQDSHRTVTSPALTREALAFLEQTHDGPFFLFLHYFDVHYDYVPPEEIWRRFDPDYRGDLTAVPFSNDRRIHREMPERELQHLRALYDGEIFFTDHYVGRLLEALDRLGLADDTLVVLSSDHGEEFFEHGGKGHRKNLFDEVLKIPLLMRLPDRAGAGLRIASQVALIDVMPTLLDLLGLPIPAEVQGRSLVPELRGDAGESGEVLARLVLPGTLSSVALRTPEWKLVVRDGTEPPQLYDLLSDPREAQPLSGDAHAARLAEARARLSRFEAAEQQLAERLPASNVEIELPSELREALEQLGYGE